MLSVSAVFFAHVQVMPVDMDPRQIVQSHYQHGENYSCFGLHWRKIFLGISLDIIAIVICFILIYYIS